MPHGLFHHSAFSDAASLALLKNGRRISVCIPTLNESATIAEIVSTIRRELMAGVDLIDEVLVIDSSSTDDTRELATAAGATVYLSSEIAASHGTHQGKGENLWKALHVATGEIICYVDGDISNFHPRFVTGLVGPLLTDDSFDYVKAHYERPIGKGIDLRPNGGGRVSEILIRPLLSLFYPELTAIFQPLSGEYAARRELLESLSFPTGYGIEIAHLIDIAASGKLSRIAQTDLDQRVHRNRTDEELGKMSFAILRTIVSRLKSEGRVSADVSIPDLYRTWNHDGDAPVGIATSVSEPERPPISSI